MSRAFDQNREARHIAQGTLSDYVDASLSARDTWEVERHLADCRECAAALKQMQDTVALLRSAERFDTGDDFMAKLHARLDGLAPDPEQGRSFTAALRDWLAGIGDTVRTRRAPALGLSIAAAGLTALVFIAQPALQTPVPTMAPAPAAASQQVQQAIERHVAETASDPLGDAAAEKLTAHTGLSDDNSAVE